ADAGVNAVPLAVPVGPGKGPLRSLAARDEVLLLAQLPLPLLIRLDNLLAHGFTSSPSLYGPCVRAEFRRGCMNGAGRGLYHCRGRLSGGRTDDGQTAPHPDTPPAPGRGAAGGWSAH